RSLTELDRMKDRFVSNVSHELRTPLANTKLYLQLLERGKPDKRAEYMQTLHREVSHLEGMIEDLLDLSQLEQDKTEVWLAPVDLNALLKQASVVQQPRAETAGLGLTFEPTAKPLLARGDLLRLQQVATNLITNAINYTPAGAVHIRSFQCDDRVGFEIRDSGMGIASEDLPHVFERFYRGKRASQSNVRGTGLGLNIVKEIVDWHGGQIEVDSQVGCGSSFTVYLPSADAAG
ncbi:MAG: HAMP domain-containing histidine kinase, partial [Chloroflexi bacterium]|nr:HAMP domain-containing histidine kinase [Chloroflexota bacterium]